MLGMALIETIADDIALRVENEQLRKMLRMEPGISCRVAGWCCLKEAAFNVESLRLWAVRGDIDAVRIGGGWQVRTRSAIAYAQRQKGGPRIN
jgi:hypothetical protein